MSDMEKMVSEFIEKFDGPHDFETWVKLVDEEAKELVEAYEHLLKEAADFAYVITGAILTKGDKPQVDPTPEQLKGFKVFGLLQGILNDKLFDEVFKRVHASNMSKLDPETGKPIKREDGKILKPITYKPLVFSDLV